MCAFRDLFLTQSEAILSKCLYNTTGWYAVWRRVERAGEISKVTKRVAPTLRLMCVVVCDGLCVCEHAYESVCLWGAEDETERR